MHDCVFHFPRPCSVIAPLHQQIIARLVVEIIHLTTLLTRCIPPSRPISGDIRLGPTPPSPRFVGVKCIDPRPFVGSWSRFGRGSVDSRIEDPTQGKRGGSPRIKPQSKAMKVFEFQGAQRNGMGTIVSQCPNTQAMTRFLDSSIPLPI